MRFTPTTFILLSTLALVTAVDPLQNQVDALFRHSKAHADAIDERCKKVNALYANEHYNAAQRVASGLAQLPPPANVDPKNPASLDHHAHEYADHLATSRGYSNYAHNSQALGNDAKVHGTAVRHITNSLKHQAFSDAHYGLATKHRQELFNATYNHHIKIKSHFDPSKPDPHNAAYLAHLRDSVSHRQQSKKSMEMIKGESGRDELAFLVKNAANADALARKHGEKSEFHKQFIGQDSGRVTPPGGHANKKRRLT